MSAILEYPHRHAISAREYLRMGEAGVFSPEVHLELIEGEIIEMAPIGSSHAAVVNKLAAYFNRIAGDRVIVSVQNPVITGERSVPQPDLALLKPCPDGYFDAHPMASDVFLVIEVSDTTLQFDLKVKGPVYAHAGVAEVWVVDLESRIVRVFRGADPTGYRTTLLVACNEHVNPHALPDVQIGVATLFPAAR